MVREVLEAPVARRALALQRRLAEGSPFALVRAVELASPGVSAAEADGQANRAVPASPSVNPLR